MKVSFNTIEEVRISHLFKTSVGNLTKMEAISDKPSLYWCAGYLFTLYEFPAESIYVKTTEGLWNVESLTVAECPDYLPEAKWNGYTVEAIDLSGHSNYETMLKEVRCNQVNGRLEKTKHPQL